MDREIILEGDFPYFYYQKFISVACTQCNSAAFARFNIDISSLVILEHFLYFLLQYFKREIILDTGNKLYNHRTILVW